MLGMIICFRNYTGNVTFTIMMYFWLNKQFTIPSLLVSFIYFPDALNSFLTWDSISCLWLSGRKQSQCRCGPEPGAADMLCVTPWETKDTSTQFHLSRNSALTTCYRTLQGLAVPPNGYHSESPFFPRLSNPNMGLGCQKTKIAMAINIKAASKTYKNTS
jgi:hypothetical protein